MIVKQLRLPSKISKNSLINPKSKKKYSKNFKKRVVQYYLSGVYDLKSIKSKFHISSKLVHKWRIWYYHFFEKTYHQNEKNSTNSSATYRAIREKIEAVSTRTSTGKNQKCQSSCYDSPCRKSLHCSHQKKLWHQTIREIKDEFPNASLQMLCDFFGKTRQAWYKSQREKEIQEMKDLLIVDHVKHIRKYLPRLGTRKLHHMLGGFFNNHNIKMGRDKLFDLLREHGLLIRKKRRTAKTTNSNHHYRKHPNRIVSISPTRANQIWVSDITYIRIGNSFSYLSLITDAYSRKIVGWDLSESLQADGAIRALKMALKQRDDKLQNLTHHSDRGTQYCCKAYIKILNENNVAVSMTQNSEPTENAMAERINRTLKEEFLQYYNFFNHRQATRATRKAVKYYNEQRPHSSINFLTPSQAHLKTGVLKKRWKIYLNQYQKSIDLNNNIFPKSRA